MKRKQKKTLIRIIIAAVLLIALNVIPIGDIINSVLSHGGLSAAGERSGSVISGVVRLALFLIPYAVIGYDILYRALIGIKNLRPLDENFLMAAATLGAFAINIYGDFAGGDYNEAVAVMLFYQVGEFFQSYAVGKSRKNITELMDIRPDCANIERDGKITQVDPAAVEPGTVIIVRPGEKVPIDGVVEEGSSTLDTLALTGESRPRNVGVGDEIISGCVNMTGLLSVRTTKEFGESTVSKILDLVENAGSRKSKSEEFISKFARIYTPAVVGCAVVLAVIPPLFRMFILGGAPEWDDWIYRALTFLVISCPCALVISIPLSFFAGIGGASREGILIKGSNYLETLAGAGVAVFDKTGTLTEGVFEVRDARSVSMPEDELLEYAAYAESASNHPIAASIRRAWAKTRGSETEDSESSLETRGSETGRGGSEPENRGSETEDWGSESDAVCLSGVSDIREISGRGVIASVRGRKVAAGNLALMEDEGIHAEECGFRGTVVYVAIDGVYQGCLEIADVVKATSCEAVSELKKAGIKKTVMLTGDSRDAAEDTARVVGIDEVYSSLLPADKVDIVERLLSEGGVRGKLLFAGDGINDAPVLARADVGIAMGALGSDAAIEAADVVLMDDDPLKIVKGIKIARKCMRIVRENIWFALVVKFVCLVIGALGIASMWLAVFADVGVMIIAVLNAVRALRVHNL